MSTWNGSPQRELTTNTLSGKLGADHAFQLAGYQHVIGTLWPIGDTAARELAHDFYNNLTDEGTTPPRPSLAAHALHHAERRLRDLYPATPTLWAAHTHTGT
jgi:CHAT domain-containing protein